MNIDEKMKNFHPKVILQKYAIFSKFTSVAKWGGTLFLCIQYVTNPYFVHYDHNEHFQGILMAQGQILTFMPSIQQKVFKK